jgi:hypothetical protein
VEAKAKTATNHATRFEVFDEMFRARDFRLALCADVLECIAEDAVEEARRNGKLEYLLEDPLVVREMRAVGDCFPGPSGIERPVLASAL